MKAKIRMLQKDESKELAIVDLMRFTEEDIRKRLVDKGFSYHSKLWIVSIIDWQVDVSLTFDEVRLLKKAILDLYDGDETFIVELLKAHWSVYDIVSKGYYVKAGDSDLAVIKSLLASQSTDQLAQLIYSHMDYKAFLKPFTSSGYLLATSKGYYVKKI